MTSLRVLTNFAKVLYQVTSVHSKQLTKSVVFFVIIIMAFTGCLSKSANKRTEASFSRALLASRFLDLEDFMMTVKIEYISNISVIDSSSNVKSTARLTYSNSGQKTISILESGLSQGDILTAKEGSILDKTSLVFNSPFAIRHRNELNKIYTLARRLPEQFDVGDVAFYDLAEASVASISSPKLAYQVRKDSSEKGYINTFNHVTAQVFITALFTEELADFIADVHELKHMPELTSGKFSKAQLNDTLNYPVDNYVDMINNEIGQEIGNHLKYKYSITKSTKWTPDLTSNFLNDIQSYYMWAMNIGMNPYSSEQEIVTRFTDKINFIKGIESNYSGKNYSTKLSAAIK